MQRKAIKNYEGLYEVSDTGQIKALKKTVNKGKCHRSWEEHYLKFAVDSNGYLRTNLAKNGHNHTVKVHRIVAEAFIENPSNKSEVNHKDGNKQNNRIENLERVTHSENLKHAYDKKLKVANGENNPARKLTYDEVKFIRENYIPHHKNYGAVALAKKFNVHRKTISRIALKRYRKEGDKDVKRKTI